METTQQIASLPLHDSAKRRITALADRYTEDLLAQAKIVAAQSGAEQVSAAHVDRAYHLLPVVPRSRYIEGAKVFGGAFFGVGVALFPVGLDANPVNVLVTICAALSACIGIGFMVWGVSR